MSAATVALILKSLELLSLGIALAPELRAAFDRQLSLLETMIKEGRDPTPEETGELDATMARLRDAFQKPVAPAAG